MATHYTLMQYAIPREYMLPFVQACNDNLEYFVTADDLLGDMDSHPITEINDIFDLTSEEFKTIAVRINPFKRMVLFYKSKTNPTLDALWKMGPNYVDYTVCKTFTEFLDLYLSTNNPNYSSHNAVNIAPFYISADSSVSISYLLDFDNFNVDIRTIPEFANVADVNYLAEAHAACSDYQELYTEADKLKVAEVFAVDIAAWNYTFE